MLHHPGQADHHRHRQKNGGKGRNVPAEVMHIRAKNRVDQMRKRHLTVHNAHKGQRREQSHNPLRIVENARGFENQNKSQGHKRIKHPSHQTIEQNFDTE